MGWLFGLASETNPQFPVENIQENLNLLPKIATFLLSKEQ